MNSYVESVLAQGEHIVYRASISRWKYWIYYLLGTACALGGLSALVDVYTAEDISPAVAAAATLLGACTLLAAAVLRLSTELVLTDRRIIVKRGVFARDTLEMNLAKVETIRVSQGVLGRILNYGNVAVIGTGSTLEPLAFVARPLELRRQLGAIATEKATPPQA